MKNFDLNEFKAQFGALMTNVRNRIAELDVVGDKLHRSVTAFTARAL